MSRRIEDLCSEMQKLYKKFECRMFMEGLDFIVTCTFRPQEEQDKLYAQGRTEPGIVVTWTKKSRHTEREAFDIAIITNGKLNWGNKCYERPGQIGQEVGLEWGGCFEKKDRPHFQLKRQ